MLITLGSSSIVFINEFAMICKKKMSVDKGVLRAAAFASSST
jgi:hypothetical protein